MSVLKRFNGTAWEAVGGSVSVNVVAPPGHPIALETGRYGFVATEGFGGPSAPPQGEMFAIPVYFPRSAAITALGVHGWAGGSTGAVVRLGLYASAAGSETPEALLAEGTAVATGTGLLTVAISQAVTAGTLYHVAFASQGAPASAPTFLTLKDSYVPLGATVSAAEATQTTMHGYSRTGITGAFPNPWGALARASTVPPRIFVGS